MKLGEAIEFLGALQKDIESKGMPTFSDALKLGIEALKAQKLRHDIWGISNIAPLPGETKD